MSIFWRFVLFLLYKWREIALLCTATAFLAMEDPYA
jgi:hypothetical protein